MSFISLIVPAFHLNTTDLSEIKDQCSIEFNSSEKNFDIIEIKDGTSNNNFGIIFNESSLSLNSIEDLIYEKNCIQALCQKTVESIQIITKKLNDLDYIINSFNNNFNNENEEECNNDSNSKNKINLDINLNNNSISNNNEINDYKEDLNEDKIKSSKITLKNIKIEFKNIVKEFEILNKNVSDNKSLSGISGKSERMNMNTQRIGCKSKLLYQNNERFCLSNNNIIHFKLENVD